MPKSKDQNHHIYIMFSHYLLGQIQILQSYMNVVPGTHVLLSDAKTSCSEGDKKQN